MVITSKMQENLLLCKRLLHQIKEGLVYLVGRLKHIFL